MQNLTARYNYIYNANILLETYVSELYSTYPEDYNELLPVHISPQKFDPVNLAANTPNKVLDEIINKSRTIIKDKSLSNYLDDAYLLLGKAEFYKGNFFLAAEYFDYVAKSYPKNTATSIDALDWQARTQMQLNEFESAATILDSLENHLAIIKKKPAEPLATLGQMALAVNRPKDAISYLEAAIQQSKLKRNSIRWHFILGQIYQDQKDHARAAAHYRKVQSSNTGFELYFNARLNLVEVNAMLSGSPLRREEQLLSLLKDEKNQEFSDQIYYKIAQYFQEQQSYKRAAAYYNKAIEAVTTNTTLKGLAYLSLAELHVTQFHDYLQAKKYYDNALSSLNKDYPDYDLIQKKSQSLDYLSSRYEAIATEDSLQLLATLPEANREVRARQMRFLVDTTSTAAVVNFSATLPLNPPQTGTFYFQNQHAIERGYADFIKRWGNRKLEDNWRQSIRATTTNTQQTLSLDPLTLQPNNGSAMQSSGDSLQLANFLASVPVNPQMMRASNERIVNAYLELASFYEQELKASQEAAAIYEHLLSSYPDNSQLAAINYSLYLIHQGHNQEKAEKHKNEVLVNHASSIYARILLNPNLKIDQNIQELEISNAYNTLFDLYLQKDFPKVIALANQSLASNPQGKMAAQFAYLKAIAVGRTKPVDSLIQQFQEIKASFPNDNLIVPLVNDHLKYIMGNLATFHKRNIALIDFDPNEPRFFAQGPQNNTPAIANVPASQGKQTQSVKAPVVTPAAKGSEQPAIATGEQAATQKIDKTSLFSKAASSTWYFVVDVEDASIRLSTSRFGIGQFSRGNYPENDLRHQLLEFDNDQLIYVGNFSNFEAAKEFQERITPQMNRIMRIRPTLFNTFIISKENFDIIKSKSLLNEYLEFYKNNY
jgi:tetratricopeptide (TPR) repeat protein